MKRVSMDLEKAKKRRLKGCRKLKLSPALRSTSFRKLMRMRMNLMKSQKKEIATLIKIT